MTQIREDLFLTIYDHYFLEHLHTMQYLQYVIEECERIGRKFVWRKPFTVHLEGDVIYVPPKVMMWMHKWYNPENIQDRQEWLMSVCEFIKDTDAGPKVFMNRELAETVRADFDYAVERLKDMLELQRKKTATAQG